MGIADWVMAKVTLHVTRYSFLYRRRTSESTTTILLMVTQ